MHVLYHNENTLYITGGIDKEKKVISNKAYIFNPETGEVEELPPMHQIRYMHFGIKFKNKLYIIGGK